MLENVIEKSKCVGCMACKNICPKNAINIKIDKNGFEYPEIDENICVKCGMCKKVCPVLHLHEDKLKNIEVYACINKNDGVRLESSSGGVFSLIAEYILRQNGVVFGAKFNNKLEVVHDYAENLNELEQFRGSKYLQSQINDSYKKAKFFLESGRKVLFTGTPCQIEGLICYLSKDYENLYTQDIICHGVPSPKVWKKNLEYRKQLKGELPINVNFRRKDILGWSNYQVSYKYSKEEKNICHRDDPYMLFFLNNLNLRESCYQCNFKKINRNSDITIADFWGINNINKNLNDEKGISAVIVNSNKGKHMLEAIKQDLKLSKANIEDIIKYNSCINKSTWYNKDRERFFDDLEKNDFEYLIEKYL